MALNELDRHEEALESADRALGLDPRDARCWIVKGYAFHALGRFSEAAGSYDRAREIEPLGPRASRSCNN